MRIRPDFFARPARAIFDFALPPRCIACGEIVAASGSLCASCWNKARFLTTTACFQCGRPLPEHMAPPGTQTRCAPCQSRPPAFDSMRAVLAYGEIARAVAVQLKHGRHIAHARTIAMLMARLVPEERDCLLVPVPLHRWRLWRRGFNQSALIAGHLSRLTGIPHDPFVMKRIRSTPILANLNPTQRSKAVRSAFDVPGNVAGRNLVLIDDVYTTGATARACAKALKKAGARRVDLLCWARVCPELAE